MRRGRLKPNSPHNTKLLKYTKDNGVVSQISIKYMGKYLQDFMYNFQLPHGQKEFTQDQIIILNPTSFIADIFSFYLPKRYEVGANIWRIIIKLTLDEKENFSIINSCSVLECKVYFDYNSLIPLDEFNRKKILLEQFYKGLEAICKKYNSDLSVFEIIKHKLVADEIVFNNFYKDKKRSPDRQHSAQMKGFYSEYYDNRALYVTIFDKYDNEKATFFVGNYNFQAFDKLKWLDNKTVGVYHINSIQSYKSKKVAEDYFSIDIETGKVIYNPVTKESIFDYGVKLLTEMNLYEPALYYIKQAKEMGHGKAENILKNLEIEPNLRDKAKLLQTPKKIKK